MNIVEPILFQAKYQPGAPALCAQGIDVVSYERLIAQMNNVARRALAGGLKRGDVAALSIEDPLLHAIAILGLTQVGIVTVSVGMHKPPAGLKLDSRHQEHEIPLRAASAAHCDGSRLAHGRRRGGRNIAARRRSQRRSRPHRADFRKHRRPESGGAHA